MDPDRYLPLVAAINQQIDSFNAFLNEGRRLGHISPTRPETFQWLEDAPWGGSRWPSKDSYGVYVLAGHLEGSPAEVGIYIGKASFSRRLGHRLHSHLLHGKQSLRYTKRDPANREFVIQMLFAIPMPSDDMGPFAPALEEHLISKLRSSCLLLNRVGNR